MSGERERLLEGLYGRHAAAVHAYALRRVDRATADEVVAETFVVAWRQLDRIPPEPLPWLYGVARRVIANQMRGANRRAALLGRLSSQPVIADLEMPMSETLQQLQRLGARDREVLLLVAWEGLSQAQAAEVLGCSNVAVRVRLHRARSRLRDLLDQTDVLPSTSAVEVRCDGAL